MSSGSTSSPNQHASQNRQPDPDRQEPRFYYRMRSGRRLRTEIPPMETVMTQNQLNDDGAEIGSVLAERAESVEAMAEAASLNESFSFTVELPQVPTVCVIPNSTDDKIPRPEEDDAGTFSDHDGKEIIDCNNDVHDHEQRRGHCDGTLGAWNEHSEVEGETVAEDGTSDKDECHYTEDKKRTDEIGSTTHLELSTESRSSCSSSPDVSTETKSSQRDDSSPHSQTPTIRQRFQVEKPSDEVQILDPPEIADEIEQASTTSACKAPSYGSVQLETVEDETSTEESDSVSTVSFESDAAEQEGPPERTLFLFKLTSPVRKACLRMHTHTVFNTFMHSIIVMNCAFLMIGEPGKDDTSTRNEIIRYSELVFLSIFVLELCVRCIAVGAAFYPRAYFRSLWNIVDATVVLAGVFSAVSGSSIFSSVRLLRLLRTLKSVAWSPSMRRIVLGLFNTLPSLLQVLLMCSFFLAIYSIAGIQYYRGVLTQRCLNTTSNAIIYIDDEGKPLFCSVDNSGRQCPSGSHCIQTSTNPGSGLISFDNFPSALLVTFQCISLEGWAEVMYAVRDAYSPYAAIYFWTLAIIGGFFVVNLALAVMAAKFESTQKGMPDDNGIINTNCIVTKREDNVTGKGPSDEQSQHVLSRIQRQVYKLVTCSWFDVFVTAALLGNTASLMSYYHGMSKRERQRLVFQYAVFTGIFGIEIALKMIGLGRRFFGTRRRIQWMNVFDFVTTVGTIVELMHFDTPDTGMRISLALRTFRILRVTRLLALFPMVGVIADGIVRTIAASMSFLLLLSVFITCFALLGMNVLGGSYGTVPSQFESIGIIDEMKAAARGNFNTFLQSSLVVFQILTGDSWNEFMHVGVAHTSAISVVYFVSTVVVGNYILLNLFVAVMISNHPTTTSTSEGHASVAVRSPHEQGNTLTRKQRVCLLASVQNGGQTRDLSPLPYIQTVQMQSLPDVRTLQPTVEFQRELLRTRNERIASLGSRCCSQTWGNVHHSVRQFTRIVKRPFQTRHDFSLFIWGRRSRMRRFCTAIVTSLWYEWLSLALVLAGTMLIVYDNHIDGNSALDFSEMFVLCTLGAEVFLNVISKGLYWPRKTAFLRTVLGVVDVAVLISLAVSIASDRARLATPSTVRLLRVLHPLRFVGRFRGTRRVCVALVRSMRSVISVGFVTLIVWTTYGLLGVQLFSGKMGYCSGDIHLNRTQCEDAQHAWKVHQANFDDSFQALLTLLRVAILDNWGEVMYNVMAITGVDTAPVEGSAPLWSIYFVSFVIVGSLLMLNLFVGVLVESLSRHHDDGDTDDECCRAAVLPLSETGKAASAGLFMTAAQRKWAEAHQLLLSFSEENIYMLKKMRNEKLKKSKLYYITKMVSTRFFETFIIILVVLNFVTMTLEHEGQSAEWTHILTTLSFAFTVIYTVEALLRVVALGWRWYWKSNWNRFDLCILVASWVTVLIGEADVSGAVRLFRVFRALKLLRSMRGLRTLFNTLIVSLPSLLNVGVLLFVMYFIFALMGIQLYSSLPRSGGLNAHTNFENFYSSMSTLLRISGGESWHALMHTCMHTDANCSAEEGECGHWSAALYFISFYVIGTFITLNLVIAILLESFVGVVAKEKRVITEDVLRKYMDTWREFDTDGTFYIPMLKLGIFLRLLGTPLGIDKTASHIELMRIVHAMHIPDRGGKIHFVDLLNALCERVLGAPAGVSYQRKLMRQWKALYPEVNFDAAETKYNMTEIYACVRIQLCARRFLQRVREAPTIVARTSDGSVRDDAIDRSEQGEMQAQSSPQRGRTVEGRTIPTRNGFGNPEGKPSSVHVGGHSEIRALKQCFQENGVATENDEVTITTTGVTNDSDCMSLSSEAASSENDANSEEDI